MEVSSCCGAPLMVEIQSDLPNFTDDDYDLKVPIIVCSICGAVIEKLDDWGRWKNGIAKGSRQEPES